MDPDACLKEMRELVIAINTATDHRDIEGYAADLAEHIEALDDWLANKGGFLPLAWSIPYAAVVDGKEVTFRMSKAFELGGAVQRSWLT